MNRCLFPWRSLWQANLLSTKRPFYQPSSKRRRGFPSETRVKRGHRFVHGNKELIEKLGRNDLCPCGSQRRFQEMLSAREEV
ncbi:MAG: SEC-C metal-binding domain-containing protein [Blastocatellia bacterium]